MPPRPTKASQEPKPKRAPAKSIEGRENQLVSAAIDLAEKQILAGTASATVITHFLKLGSTRERAEQTKIEQENAVLRAKVESIESGSRIEEMYSNAIKAMREYSGNGSDDDEG